MKFTDPVSVLPLVGEAMETKLKKLGIKNVRDLLHHVPSRYSDYSNVTPLNEVQIGDQLTIEAQVVSIKNIFSKSGKVMQEAVISDGEHSLIAVWFRQTYLPKTLPPGTQVAFTGKIGFWGKKKAIVAPSFEKLVENTERLHSGRIVPTYRETAGVTSKWLRRVVHNTLKQLSEEDFLSSDITEKYVFADLITSLKLIHEPATIEDVELGRRRLAFNELLMHQLAQRERQMAWTDKHAAKKLSVSSTLLLEFLSKLPFTPTKSQIRAMGEIANDLALSVPMNRLLEGDVGSGKTAVAAFAMFVGYLNGVTSLIMAPTQILAAQHAQTISSLLAPFNIPVIAVSSIEKAKKINETAVYVGTHALLFKLIHSQVGVIVIDEQHRFGVTQRAQLAEQGKRVPHVLTMTATPIPRTIALTLYGDLALSTLDELPAGRKKITTWVIPPKKRKASYEWIDKQIEETDSQVFVVCPLIDESESEKMKEVKAAKTEFERLTKVFKNRRLTLLHGKMKVGEKQAVLDDFKAKKYDILVTTPVVEVGIDIPNATIMMIEAADRFGLAALHQLRGRVGRGEKQSYCLLMSDNQSEKSKKRLTAMSKTMSGLELAELDLSLRGPGEIFGTKQSGIAELTIARWTDVELIKLSKEVADHIMTNPEDFRPVFEYYKGFQEAAN